MMDSPDKCSYCNEIIECDDFLNCTECKLSVHIKCLKRPGTPGDLLGDVFFEFKCFTCSEDGKETFGRQNLPWLMVVTMALYNLSIQSKGLSHHGFFHWRTHISNFIEKNWNFLFVPHAKRKKKWIGTISGVLSHNSPHFFISGQEMINDAGWWKLTYNQTPKFYMKLYEQLCVKRQQLRNDKRSADDASCSSDISTGVSEDSKRLRKDAADDEEPFSRTMPYMGREPKKLKLATISGTPAKDLSRVQSNLMDFISASLDGPELLLNDLPNMPQSEFLPFISGQEPLADTWIDAYNNGPSSYEVEEELKSSIGDGAINYKCSTVKTTDYKPRIIQVTNFQESKMSTETKNFLLSGIKKETESSEDEEENFTFVCEKSLFNVSSKRELPWKDEQEILDDRPTANENTDSYFDNRIEMMSEYEEKELYKKLKAIIDNQQNLDLDIPTWIRRFYRKLSLRILKRSISKPIFDIDNFDQKVELNRTRPQILDRYHHLTSTTIPREDSSFHARITGSVQYELFESPLTSRVLHPFIFRNSKCFPPWVKLMCEMQFTVTSQVPKRHPIDFCYVRPHHIAAVNGLLQRMFWPGIDMSDCLSYPDFSVVALYKKLLVGCAFLVPDVSHNEAYISFMAVRPGWQRCGIATYMLYHLTQTCMGKDITLHVSATNPAICLYQKFGFKIEEVILEFYEKYLPIESSESRHAFFLRLTR